MSTTTDVMRALMTGAKSLGSIDNFKYGEWKSPPPPGLSFCLWVRQLGVATTGSGLATTTADFPVTARLMMPMLHKPEDEIELKLTDAADGYLGWINGHITLNGLVRNVDLFSEQGVPLIWEYGYIAIGGAGGTIYRSADLPISSVINDHWTQAA